MNKLPVAVICDRSPARALLVAPDMKLDRLRERLLAQKSKKPIFLADENGRVINDLHIDDLLAYALQESRGKDHV